MKIKELSRKDGIHHNPVLVEKINELVREVNEMNDGKEHRYQKKERRWH